MSSPIVPLVHGREDAAASSFNIPPFPTSSPNRDGPETGNAGRRVFDPGIVITRPATHYLHA